ncbi:DEAD/DEAH box helicase [Corynebacterium ureicelerivorans]|uniref:DEAD/DEAH box helicase n=1 Tax=Corynebacterium ureicelerivorans TaxID=401472 RepID=UPI0026544853|nr:DEAD/DEAH box helicase [Corynebacterium ureicelerivorans]MDN8604566.1 DEAD/DEAH box helicase [Corynebacterium ureicelerivorans]
MLPEKITLNQIRLSRNLKETTFERLYRSLMLGNELDEDEYISLLAIAITFISRGDSLTRHLGYRIILKYSLSTSDFEPLLDLARTFDFAPIASSIERIASDQKALHNETLSSLLKSAYFQSSFVDSDGIVRTLGQFELRTFVSEHENALVVAPTSYGKSELLIDSALKTLSEPMARVCILVPTKALIAQTRREIISTQRKSGTRYRIITHPEAYNGEARFIGVLTQERLLSLITRERGLDFDRIYVDEAQNLFEENSRSILLSTLLLVLKNRNPSTAISYFTPYLDNPGSLRHLTEIDAQLSPISIGEKLKSETFFGIANSEVFQFDPFLGSSFGHEFSSFVEGQEAGLINRLRSRAALVYVNSPRDAEDLASELSELLPATEAQPPINEAAEAIGEFFHPDYKLVEMLRRGVAYHHGRMPEIVRDYVENLFSSTKYTPDRILVCTSTLLEGVNTPADKLFVLSGKRGNKKLTPSAFRNLVGRVGRFNQIFNAEGGQLDLLMPEVWVVKSEYAHRNFNPERFLKETVDQTKSAEMPVENPLLHAGQKGEVRRSAIERVINTEEVPFDDRLTKGVRKATSQIAQLCFAKGINEIDPITYEDELQANYEAFLESTSTITSASELINAIKTIFLKDIEISGGKRNPTRLALESLRTSVSARKFHSMHLDWRLTGLTFKEKILRQVRYWNATENPLIFVGSSWGEVKRDDKQVIPLYIDKRNKSRTDLVNFAIIRIKEEMDLIDHVFLKFTDVLLELDLLNTDLFLKLKYGTTSEQTIALMQNGFSFELAKAVVSLDGYSKYLHVDLENNALEISDSAFEWIRGKDINELLLFEFETLMNI